MLYFDYMATTPVDPRVRDKMWHYLGQEGVFGNASAVNHLAGQRALQAVEAARAQVANTLNASPTEIIFTSGATESNNLALLGVARFYKRQGNHIISMQTEHPSVLEPLAQLEREGFDVTYLAPQPDGLLDLSALERALRAQTLLVSCMHVNNEIGVIQPIVQISALLKARGILFHVDAAQSVGKIPVDVQAMGVDLLSLSAHKNYGPKGVGALYVRSHPRIRLTPVLFGGGQERGIRPGTLPTHQIVGMGEAFEIGEKERETSAVRILALRQTLWEGLRQRQDVHLNGNWEHRVPGNLNVSFAGLTGEQLLTHMPQLAVSTSSACAAERRHPSYVLKAMGLSVTLCLGAVRFSLGRYTTMAEVQAVLHYLSEVK